MKHVFILSGLLAFIACGESKKDEPAMIKKVVCGDSIETSMFDSVGNEVVMKMAGKCDTILEPAPEH